MGLVYVWIFHNYNVKRLICPPLLEPVLREGPGFDGAGDEHVVADNMPWGSISGTIRFRYYPIHVNTESG